MFFKFFKNIFVSSKNLIILKRDIVYFIVIMV